MAELTQEEKQFILDNTDELSGREISRRLWGSDSRKSTVNDFIKKKEVEPLPTPDKGVKMLFIDIESSPILGSVWSLWKQNVGLNQIDTDWFILSYCAKWYGQEEVYYEDLRSIVEKEDDSSLLESIWTLLDKADIVVAHNANRFDVKKINARFILNGYKPPSSFKVVDTLEVVKRKFAFTSNKLEYLTSQLCTTHKKSKHAKFSGFDLWKECLADNEEAWVEMEDYNKEDVLSLEELYTILAPWDNRHPNVTHYEEDSQHKCTCGSTEFEKSGYHYTQVSKFQKYRCTSCGSEYRSRENMFDKTRRQDIMVKV